MKKGGKSNKIPLLKTILNKKRKGEINLALAAQVVDSHLEFGGKKWEILYFRLHVQQMNGRSGLNLITRATSNPTPLHKLNWFILNFVEIRKLINKYFTNLKNFLLTFLLFQPYYYRR